MRSSSPLERNAISLQTLIKKNGTYLWSGGLSITGKEPSGRLLLTISIRYRYDYQQKNIDQNNFLGNIPSWNDCVVAKLKEAKLVVETPQQLLVNEYEPGQGISRHIDSTLFAEPVITLSLGSGCIFVLTQQSTRIELYLKPKTLIILRGDSRWKWTHEIPSRKSDLVDGVKIHRGRRISLTYRFVKK